MVSLHAQLPGDLVISQVTVVTKYDRHAIVFRQPSNGLPHCRLLLRTDDLAERRKLRACYVERRSVFLSFHDHLPFSLLAPQHVYAVVAGYAQQPAWEWNRAVVGSDGAL